MDGRRLPQPAAVRDHVPPARRPSVLLGLKVSDAILARNVGGLVTQDMFKDCARRKKSRCVAS
jgi:hypothetical protein